jgi:hypothetical protein
MNSSFWGKKFVKFKKKTNLIKSCVAFIYSLYTYKLLAIYTCYITHLMNLFGAFWKLCQILCNTYKSPLEMDYKNNSMIFYIMF